MFIMFHERGYSVRPINPSLPWALEWWAKPTLRNLRAERLGQGNGRVYTVYFTADDGLGGTLDRVQSLLWA